MISNEYEHELKIIRHVEVFFKCLRQQTDQCERTDWLRIRDDKNCGSKWTWIASNKRLMRPN